MHLCTHPASSTGELSSSTAALGLSSEPLRVLWPRCDAVKWEDPWCWPVCNLQSKGEIGGKSSCSHVLLWVMVISKGDAHFPISTNKKDFSLVPVNSCLLSAVTSCVNCC